MAGGGAPPPREAALWRYGLEEKPRRGFLLLPRRWVVERTFAWLGQARRLAKDYERLPESGVAMILWAMSRIMLCAGSPARSVEMSQEALSMRLRGPLQNSF